MENIQTFVLLAVVLSLVPGPDGLLVLRSTVREGRRGGMATAAGAATGSLVWALAAVVGLAIVVRQSADAYQALRIAGAGYLVVLGVSTLLHRNRAVDAPTNEDSFNATKRPLRGCFAAGLLSDVLNPKVGMFYLAVVPQFVPAGAPVAPYTLLLCAIEIAIAVAWLVVLVWVAGSAIDWLRRPRVQQRIERLVGVALVSVGAKLAIDT